ncbi:MAG: hypothetical protein IJX05_06130 [Clostridia bacterium]|nr:hypothetical protein [Clostridia bacterium]
MQLVKCKYRIKCELGACGNRADYSLLPARSGIRSILHVCEPCLTELSALISEELGEKEGK